MHAFLYTQFLFDVHVRIIIIQPAVEKMAGESKKVQTGSV